MRGLLALRTRCGGWEGGQVGEVLCLQSRVIASDKTAMVSWVIEVAHVPQIKWVTLLT